MAPQKCKKHSCSKNHSGNKVTYSALPPAFMRCLKPLYIINHTCQNKNVPAVQMIPQEFHRSSVQNGQIMSNNNSPSIQGSNQLGYANRSIPVSLISSPQIVPRDFQGINYETFRQTVSQQTTQVLVGLQNPSSAQTAPININGKGVLIPFGLQSQTNPSVGELSKMECDTQTDRQTEARPEPIVSWQKYDKSRHHSRFQSKWPRRRSSKMPKHLSISSSSKRRFSSRREPSSLTASDESLSSEVEYDDDVSYSGEMDYPVRQEEMNAYRLESLPGVASDVPVNFAMKRIMRNPPPMRSATVGSKDRHEETQTDIEDEPRQQNTQTIKRIGSLEQKAIDANEVGNKDNSKFAQTDSNTLTAGHVALIPADQFKPCNCSDAENRVSVYPVSTKLGRAVDNSKKAPKEVCCITPGTKSSKMGDCTDVIECPNICQCQSSDSSSSEDISEESSISIYCAQTYKPLFPPIGIDRILEDEDKEVENTSSLRCTNYPWSPMFSNPLSGVSKLPEQHPLSVKPISSQTLGYLDLMYHYYFFLAKENAKRIFMMDRKTLTRKKRKLKHSYFNVVPNSTRLNKSKHLSRSLKNILYRVSGGFTNERLNGHDCVQLGTHHNWKSNHRFSISRKRKQKLLRLKALNKLLKTNIGERKLLLMGNTHYTSGISPEVELVQNIGRLEQNAHTDRLEAVKGLTLLDGRKKECQKCSAPNPLVYLVSNDHSISNEVFESQQCLLSQDSWSRYSCTSQYPTPEDNAQVHRTFYSFDYEQDDPNCPGGVCKIEKQQRPGTSNCKCSYIKECHCSASFEKNKICDCNGRNYTQGPKSRSVANKSPSKFVPQTQYTDESDPELYIEPRGTQNEPLQKASRRTYDIPRPSRGVTFSKIDPFDETTNSPYPNAAHNTIQTNYDPELPNNDKMYIKKKEHDDVSEWVCKRLPTNDDRSTQVPPVGHFPKRNTSTLAQLGSERGSIPYRSFVSDAGTYTVPKNTSYKSIQTPKKPTSYQEQQTSGNICLLGCDSCGGTMPLSSAEKNFRIVCKNCASVGNRKNMSVGAALDNELLCTKCTSAIKHLQHQLDNNARVSSKDPNMKCYDCKEIDDDVVLCEKKEDCKMMPKTDPRPVVQKEIPTRKSSVAPPRPVRNNTLIIRDSTRPSRADTVFGPQKVSPKDTRASKQNDRVTTLVISSSDEEESSERNTRKEKPTHSMKSVGQRSPSVEETFEEIVEKRSSLRSDPKTTSKRRESIKRSTMRRSITSDEEVQEEDEKYSRKKTSNQRNTKGEMSRYSMKPLDQGESSLSSDDMFDKSDEEQGRPLRSEKRSEPPGKRTESSPRSSRKPTSPIAEPVQEGKKSSRKESSRTKKSSKHTVNVLRIGPGASPFSSQNTRHQVEVAQVYSPNANNRRISKSENSCSEIIVAESWRSYENADIFPDGSCKIKPKPSIPVEYPQKDFNIIKACLRRRQTRNVVPRKSPYKKQIIRKALSFKRMNTERKYGDFPNESLIFKANAQNAYHIRERQNGIKYMSKDKQGHTKVCSSSSLSNNSDSQEIKKYYRIRKEENESREVEEEEESYPKTSEEGFNNSESFAKTESSSNRTRKRTRRDNDVTSIVGSEAFLKNGLRRKASGKYRLKKVKLQNPKRNIYVLVKQLQ